MVALVEPSAGGDTNDAFRMLESSRFRYSSLEEAETLAVFLSNCFPDPRRTYPGLREILVNAVEYGILNLDGERKNQMADAQEWHGEILQRQAHPDYQGRFVEVTVARREDGVYVVIQDPGEGFNWKKYIDIDPSRSAHSNGRGIAFARSVAFDKLTYNEQGTQAIGFVRYKQHLDW